MERERVYYSEYCPQCRQRACLTQAVDFCDLRVCVDAVRGDKCWQIGCCHGCQCQMDQECAEEECDCDCHRNSLLIRLREDGEPQQMEVIPSGILEVIDLTSSPDPPTPRAHSRPPVRKTATTITNGPCQCEVCLGRVPLREYTANGVIVSNRPRYCPRFAHGERDVVSTCYNNEDGRNRRLEEFFTRK